jgi:hypothetical protein
MTLLCLKKSRWSWLSITTTIITIIIITTIITIIIITTTIITITTTIITITTTISEVLAEAALHLMERVYCLLGNEPAMLVGGRVWVFLAPRGFAAKALLLSYWISLVFLGFSRPNLDFSMGYAR